MEQPSGDPPAGSGTEQTPSQSDSQPGSEGSALKSAQPHAVRRVESGSDRMQRRAPGRRSKSRTRRKQGRYITSRAPLGRLTDLALDATLRAAAPFQPGRRSPGGRMVALERQDLREKVRVRRTRNTVCFVVDASWSMAAETRMQATKAAVLSLLRDAYQRRDRVGLVSFGRDRATVLLPLTNSVELAQRRLQVMPTGGKTPLSRGLLRGYELLARARVRDPEVLPLLVILTDGHANVAMTAMPAQQEAYRVADFIASQAIPTVVIDTELPNFYRGLARELADHLKGAYYRLEDLQGSAGLAELVRAQMRLVTQK